MDLVDKKKKTLLGLKFNLFGLNLSAIARCAALDCVSQSTDNSFWNNIFSIDNIHFDLFDCVIIVVYSVQCFKLNSKT